MARPTRTSDRVIKLSKVAIFANIEDNSIQHLPMWNMDSSFRLQKHLVPATSSSFSRNSTKVSISHCRLTMMKMENLADDFYGYVVLAVSVDREACSWSIMRCNCTMGVAAVQINGQQTRILVRRCMQNMHPLWIYPETSSLHPVISGVGPMELFSLMLVGRGRKFEA